MPFNENNPATSSLLISGDIRANFLATRRHMYSANLLADPLQECWPDTDSGTGASLLAAWTLAGSGAALSRETLIVDRVVGDMSTRVTFGVAPAILRQDILDVASYDQYFDTRVVTAGCFLKTSTGSIGRIAINDGVTTTLSAFHTGGGGFEYLDVEHLISSGATRITFELRVEGGGNVVFNGATFLFSDIKPDRFIMSPMARSTLQHTRKGGIFVGEVDRFLPQRPFIVEHVQLSVSGVPVGSAALVDINQFDGSAFTSMFTPTGRPRVLDGEARGGAAPDGVYNRKCFTGIFGNAASLAGQQIRSEIDSVGSTTPGDDLNIYIRYKTWLRPQEIFAGFSMIG